MFPDFPKQRPPLDPDIAQIYAMHYKANREGATSASYLAQRLEAWMHRKVAKKAIPKGGQATLELGAGTLNQLRYEADGGSYDIVEPFGELYAGSPWLARVRHSYTDIAEVPDDARYDRITSVAVLEHICNLPTVVAKSGLHLREGGIFQAGVPSEGTLLWKLGWKLTTGLEFRMKYGLDYGLIMAHEHVNNAREIEQVLRYFFTRVTCRVFGISRNLSLYRYYECDAPDPDKCRQYWPGKT